MRFELGEPRIEIVAQHVLGEELSQVEPSAGNERRHIAQPPYGHRVVVGDEAQGLRAGAVEPPRQQHAERLVSEAPFERVGHEIVMPPPREGLDQHLVARRDHRAALLQFEPFGNGRRQPRPGMHVRQHGPHALGQVRRQGELAAVVGGDDGVARGCPRHEGVRLAHALEAQHLAREHEGVARAQLLDEVFVDLAEDASAASAVRDLTDLRPNSRTLMSGAATMVPALSR